MTTAAGNALPDWGALSFNHREDYVGKTALIPEIRVIGEVYSARAIKGLMVGDSHPGLYEVHLVVRGEQRFWIGAPHRVFAVGGGMAILTRPGELHGGVAEMLDPARYYWIQFSPPNAPRKGVKPVRDPTTLALARDLENLDPPAFHVSPGTEQTFRRLLAEHQHPGRHSAALVRALLRELMVLLVRDHAGHPATAPSAGAAGPLAASEMIRQAIEWMRQQCVNRISVEDVAERVGSSSSHFRRLFHREMGCSPADYLTKLRIEKATQWLTEGRMSVTDIAMRLGFSTSSYFTSVFRKRCGVTPSEFARRVAEHRE